MLEKMKDIVKANDLCVLATVSEGKPHCSLNGVKEAFFETIDQ